MPSTRSTRWLEAALRSGAAPGLITLRGSSMAPALADGDRLRVAPFGAAGPRPGEIVVARRGAQLVTHRLLAIDGTQIITRGDACAHLDPPLPVDALLGRVVEVRRVPRWRRWWARVRAFAP